MHRQRENISEIVIKYTHRSSQKLESNVYSDDTSVLKVCTYIYNDNRFFKPFEFM
jgi:uncharacterized protein (UPF0248 family)